MLRHAQTALAVLFVGAFALASGTGARARFAPPGTSAADITAAAIEATGWSSDGSYTSTALNVALAVNKTLYFNAGHTVGIVNNDTDIKIVGALPLTPNADQGINLGKPSVRWSNLYATGINLGVGGANTWSSTAPTVTSACTGPSVVNGNSVSFEVDVGTSCTGISTIVMAMPAATNGWLCSGYNKTTTTRSLRPTADTTTSITMSNWIQVPPGTAGDFVDGDNLVMNCTMR